jgi:aldehyde:ferredoxin oxidoreductase
MTDGLRRARGGYTGTVLVVNLTDRTAHTEDLDWKAVDRFVGMRGLTSKVLWDRTRGVDPLSPDNVLIFGTGPMTGVALTGGRALVAAKSPLTGMLGYANFGGHWGPALKYAGYDLLVIEGKADKPVYLLIEDGEVGIRDASALWGTDTREAIRAVRREAGDPELQVLAIGPGGENLVRFACIISYDGHCGGRTGMGAVMGSKNLKAVGVRGTQGLAVANPGEYREVFSDILEHIAADEVSGRVAPQLGTTVLLNIVNETGALGTRNFQSGYFEEAEKISGETLLEKYTPAHRGRACFLCPIACDRHTALDDGEFAGTWSGGGPEYAVLTNQGARLGNANLASIVKANEVCNRLGVDTYSTGGVLGFAFELFQRGLLDVEDTDGLVLEWGDYHVQLELIRKIAYREGIGDLLAEGTRTVAERVGGGSSPYAIQVKGMEYPSKDARGDRMYGLCCALSNRGADHLYSLSEFPADVEADLIADMFGTERASDPHRPEGKGRVVSFFEEGCTFTDLFGICKLVYVTYVASMKELMWRREVLPRLYHAVTGLDMTYDGLVQASHRVTALEKAYNISEVGTTRADDYLPARFLDEPMPDGPAKGLVFEADQMLDEYYATQGYERETSWPFIETLEELGLEDVAAELADAGVSLPRRS